MEALLGLMLMYSVGITIAFFCVLKSRNRYVSKSEFLTRKIKEMMDHSAVQRPVSSSKAADSCICTNSCS